MVGSQRGAPLLLVDKAWLREILSHVVTHKDGLVQNTIRSLKHRATLRGEWAAISHDETFKCLFSLIGQTKMSQRPGELHAAHTFLGITGACPGFSAQSGRSHVAFGAALNHLFTPEMRSQVRLLYTDSPSEDMLQYLPRCIGCAEDSLHLVIRCEYCCGGKRNQCTRTILMLQNKFLQADTPDTEEATLQRVYHGQQGPNIDWGSIATPPEKSAEEWASYAMQPFTSHEEYVAQLKGIAESFPLMMSRKDSDGRTMSEILQTRSTYRHYMYLRNNSVFRLLADGADIKTGTTANEAEHRIMKAWGECVYAQHEDRIHIGEQVYAFYRLLGNAWKNVGKQDALELRERDAVCMLAGYIASGGLEHMRPHAQVAPVVPPRTRAETRRPQIRVAQALREKQCAAKSGRTRASLKQANMDLARKKKSLVKRIRGKTPLSMHLLRPARQHRPRTVKNSSKIMNSIECSLAENVD